jgi:outer membrane receptor for ferrienterochelin and colicins
MDTITQTTPDKNQAEHIVVTGTRTAKLLSNSPVLVDVIDGGTIAKISQGTLAQALNYIPGIVIKRSVKDGYNIQMQGFDGDHVLVLIDGQPIVSPTGSSADLDQIPASNIAQIEIIRGAASVMYGSAAIGGVIPITQTK